MFRRAYMLGGVRNSSISFSIGELTGFSTLLNNYDLELQLSVLLQLQD